jgi:RNA polymerase sigma-70 factor (ECF subfamily)
MPLNPSKSLHFDSWKQLLRWLPEATESQLMTVFAWAGEQKPPPGDVGWLVNIRNEAFERLVDCSQDRLKRFLRLRCQCRDEHLVEDLVQQVLIKLFLRAEQFDPRRSFWGWLYRIARNEYIDALRRTRPGDVGVGQAGQPVDFLEQILEEKARRGATPLSIALNQERQQQLERAIESLPSLQQAIVRLKREGMKGKEIASRLGVSQAYVSQLYHEAGEILCEAIEG